MARQKGMLNLSGNLEPLAGAPLDSRSITPTVADLYVASNWPYKYIGMKTTVIATGETYRLVNLDVTQSSSWVKEGGESGQTIQYDELPAASSSLAGKIYQYIGTTNLQYTNGYFYECVNDGGTYKWVQTNTQPGSSYNDFTGATAQAAGVHGLVPAPTTGDISKFLKGDGTWATVPMPSFDYSNTSPEAMNFSTDEKVIGTWIDGKPVYQKTLSINTPTSTTEESHSIGASIDKAISINASIATPYGTNYCGSIYAINSFEKGIKFFVETNSNLDNPNSLSVYVSQDSWMDLPCYVTIQYTKTTDSPVASGEKIVGQWIDGKPLFEKVITDTMPSAVNTEKFVDVGASIDSVVDIKAIDADGGYWNAFNFFNNTCQYFSKVYATDNTLSYAEHRNKIVLLTTHSDRLNDTVYITIRYTKSS